MRDAQKADHVTLTTLIGRLREGRFVIPDFQRDFEWRPSDIRELVRSIFLDYYIGSLLLWKGKSENFQALACEPIYGFGGRRPRYPPAEPVQPLPLFCARRSVHGRGP
ncbi:MAG: DUF262 domain-containing protein [Dehalococcoidia bacterium]|nr:DUF262 domain-containing protein [Dehalococcoidia bacterium]